MDTLINNVLEWGIVNIIDDYKTNFEYLNILEKYSRNEKIQWESLSKHQYLSEDFIMEFKRKVYWEYIYYRRDYSEELCDFFKDIPNPFSYPYEDPENDES